ncbi:HD domain-containing protein [Rhodovibrionaceae bacterium A322]
MTEATTTTDTASPIDVIEDIFNRFGNEVYGENITQLEHGLQAAAVAVEEGASDSLVIAALLHDLGHLIEKADDSFGYHKHDQSGGDYLEPLFGKAVSEPVRLHVVAKKYLCAVEDDYFDKLSPASVYTLGKQGGPMSVEECKVFESNPHYKDAVRLRRWDDLGKVEGVHVEPFAHYRPMMEKLLQEQ